MGWVIVCLEPCRTCCILCTYLVDLHLIKVDRRCWNYQIVTWSLIDSHQPMFDAQSAFVGLSNTYIDACICLYALGLAKGPLLGVGNKKKYMRAWVFDWQQTKTLRQSSPGSHSLYSDGFHTPSVRCTPVSDINFCHRQLATMQGDNWSESCWRSLAKSEFSIERERDAAACLDQERTKTARPNRRRRRRRRSRRTLEIWR